MPDPLCNRLQFAEKGNRVGANESLKTNHFLYLNFHSVLRLLDADRRR